MASVCVDSAWDTLLQSDWLNSLRETRFLTKCRNGDASRPELHLFLKQQYYYARHFTRYLNALLSNLADEEDRAALTHNLFDETGVSSGVSHAQMYRRMMATILPQDFRVDIFPETQALIDTMLDCCRNSRAMVGLGAICLGAEAIVPEIYTAIVHGFEAIGEPQEHLEFFTIHIEEDDSHALTMRDIIVRELASDPQSRLDLEYGAARAIAARVGFFNAIGGRI